MVNKMIDELYRNWRDSEKSMPEWDEIEEWNSEVKDLIETFTKDDILQMKISNCVESTAEEYCYCGFFAGFKTAVRLIADIHSLLK